MKASAIFFNDAALDEICHQFSFGHSLGIDLDELSESPSLICSPCLSVQDHPPGRPAFSPQKASCLRGARFLSGPLDEIVFALIFPVEEGRRGRRNKGKNWFPNPKGVCPARDSLTSASLLGRKNWFPNPKNASA